MEFIDTHTHFYDEAFEGHQGQDEAIRRALEVGVTSFIVPDEGPATRGEMFALCSRWKGTAFPCIGLHPEELDEGWKEALDLLEKDADSHPEAVAVGETGMDLYWTKDNVDIQLEAFRFQIELSIRKSLPLIIHAREATKPILDTLEDYRGRALRGVFHAYSGSAEAFRALDRYGDWYVGIGGVLTFKKAGIANTVKDIPMERIVLETDSPYLTPVPHRGERNESSYIPIIASFLSDVKGASLEETAYQTTLNAKKLFCI